ncbi:hypothetical protein IGB42_01930 [Andreprevotia sp. IGB-42]|uniref:hypothetical protein n=1 Tax=Andreprevotia sp. IGB-42 TaxID=2497473 RepID=UPI0013567662|nr:hypothetical protein [Andreprevotia sp. IGB-42]KAF0813579.1 hypothetical protein IGB42_01930 [Andreprevotia sp. IGB-42]
MDWFNDDASWKDWAGGNAKATDTSGWDSLDLNIPSESSTPAGGTDWYSWMPPSASILASGFGMDKGEDDTASLFGGVGKALGGVYDWYQGAGPGVQGLVNSVVLGSAQAYLKGREADKQRDYERTLTEEQREYNRKMRVVPKNIAVGSAANFQGK